MSLSRYWVMVLTICACAMPVQAGMISGTVSAGGEPLKLSEVVVFVSGIKKSTANVTVDLLNKNRQFVPRFMAMCMGTKVRIVNSDDTYHNAFAEIGDRKIDIGLQNKGDFSTVVFDRPGRVNMGCAVHPNMSAVILVLENPYFSMVRENGVFSISDVPPGNYVLAAWHESGWSANQKITVTDVKTTANLSLVKKSEVEKK